jgi:predicted transposase YbfD/YdcC
MKGLLMNKRTISSQLALPDQALLFDLEALYTKLQRVKDRRKRRGVRYPLADILLIGILAKLAGLTSSRAIAEWAQLRHHELAQVFALRHQCMPHLSTWSRILGKGCDADEVEEVLGQFFAESTCKPNLPGARQLCIDGKTLRGTIPLGESHGVHLVAGYLPQEGVVLGQVQASNWGSEPSAAPRLLASIDLRGMVVTGDAIFASRSLSMKILHAQGDYLWMIKENQKQMDQDIQTLFEPSSVRPGWSAPPTDFRSASSFDKGHGRLERRRITVSSLLAGYSAWPGLMQVFKLERERTNTLGETEREVHYGITSLLPAQASPTHLLRLVRHHWGIENGLHYRRDRTLDEDRSQLRMGNAPHVLALLNNTAIGLMNRPGQTHLPRAQRAFDYQFDRALALLPT